MSRAFAELAGAPVVHGSLFVPRVGRWTARLELDAETVTTGPATLTMNDGQWALQGAVIRGGTGGGRVDALVVGGAGRMVRALPPKAYENVPARLVLSDLLTEAGESLSPRSSLSVLTTMLPTWVRYGGVAGEALTTLCDVLSASWRSLYDGSIWVGVETWPASASTAEVLDEAPGEGVLLIGPEAPDVLPGEVFHGRRVSAVEYSLSASAMRASVWLEHD